jgi:prevent-host-death family protein
VADKSVDADEAQATLGDLLTFVREGHEVLISDGDGPVARLVPVGAGGTAEGPGHPGRRRKRTPGLTPGAAHMSPDFDNPLPDSFWLGEE